MSIYYEIGGMRAKNSVTPTELGEMIRAGTIDGESKVWTAKLKEWTTLADAQDQILGVSTALRTVSRTGSGSGVLRDMQSPMMRATVSVSTSCLYYELQPGVSSKKLSVQEAEELIASGVINASSKVWAPKMSAWRRFTEVELNFQPSAFDKRSRSSSPGTPKKATHNVSEYGGVPSGDAKDTDTFKYFKYPALPKFTDKHKSLMSKTLTPELWAKMKNLKTSGGYSFCNAIQTGVETPHLGVGCTAGDEESWTLFADLYNPVIKGWHGYDPESGTHPTDLDFDKVKFPAADLAKFNKYVKSTRIRAARNISGYGLPAGATNEDRAAVEGVLKNAFAGFEGDLKGTYFPLGGMSPEQEEDLQSQGFLFQQPKTTNLLTYAGAARNWPASRGIFHNNSKTALCWCNEEDHCRIISMSKDGDVKAVFARFCEISKALAKSAEANGDKFMHSEKLGFLGTCPSNLGTGMRGSVMIHLPELNKDVHVLEEICAAFDLQPRGSDGEHSAAKGAMWDVSNKQRLGFSEVQLVQKMVDGVLKLIAIEEKLAAGLALDARTVFSSLFDVLASGAHTIGEPQVRAYLRLEVAPGAASKDVESAVSHYWDELSKQLPGSIAKDAFVDCLMVRAKQDGDMVKGSDCLRPDRAEVLKVMTEKLRTTGNLTDSSKKMKAKEIVETLVRGFCDSGDTLTKAKTKELLTKVGTKEDQLEYYWADIKRLSGNEEKAKASVCIKYLLSDEQLLPDGCFAKAPAWAENVVAGKDRPWHELAVAPSNSVHEYHAGLHDEIHEATPSRVVAGSDTAARSVDHKLENMAARMEAHQSSVALTKQATQETMQRVEDTCKEHMEGINRIASIAEAGVTQLLQGLKQDINGQMSGFQTQLDSMQAQYDALAADFKSLQAEARQP